MENKAEDYIEAHERVLDIVEDHLLRIPFRGDYKINSDLIGNKGSKGRAIVSISIDDDSYKSHLGFVYIPNKKMLDNVKAILRGNNADLSNDFLYGLENLADSLGCNELRSMPEERAGEYPGWIRYPDGTYRKNLRPNWN